MSDDNLPENVKQAVSECTPSRLGVIVSTAGERGLEGGAGGAVVGTVIPIVGTVAGLAAGTFGGIAEGLVEGGIKAFRNQPDTACMVEHLAAGTNVSPHDSPSSAPDKVRQK